MCFDGGAEAQRLGDFEDAIGRGRRKRGAHGVLVVALAGTVDLPISFRPVRPVSRPRNAFCSDSWKVRPIAMTSPTDFIAVVSVGSAPGNFSKAKRGILVTT